MSTRNIYTDASDGPHTGTPQASKNQVNDHYRYNGSQNSSVSTTGKESGSKAPITETSESEKPPENRRNFIDNIRSSFLSIKLDCWYVELGACLIGALAMTVLIIVIGRHNGKPLPKWPLHITVGTFIAVCSNITRAMLLVPVVCTF